MTLKSSLLAADQSTGSESGDYKKNRFTAYKRGIKRKMFQKEKAFNQDDWNLNYFFAKSIN